MCLGVAEEYLMPYQNMVPTDPSFEDMKKVVVVEKKRPPLPNRWNQSEVWHITGVCVCRTEICVYGTEVCVWNWDMYVELRYV